MSGHELETETHCERVAWAQGSDMRESGPGMEPNGPGSAASRRRRAMEGPVDGRELHRRPDGLETVAEEERR